LSSKEGKHRPACAYFGPGGGGQFCSTSATTKKEGGPRMTRDRVREEERRISNRLRARVRKKAKQEEGSQKKNRKKWTLDQS